MKDGGDTVDVGWGGRVEGSVRIRRQTSAFAIVMITKHSLREGRMDGGCEDGDGDGIASAVCKKYM